MRLTFRLLRVAVRVFAVPLDRSVTGNGKLPDILDQAQRAYQSEGLDLSARKLIVQPKRRGHERASLRDHIIHQHHVCERQCRIVDMKRSIVFRYRGSLPLPGRR